MARPAKSVKVKSGAIAGDDAAIRQDVENKLRGENTPPAPPACLTDEQREIFWLLSEHTLVPDEIVGRTEIPARRVNTALTLLQAGGYIKELPGKRFTAAVRFAED